MEGSLPGFQGEGDTSGNVPYYTKLKEPAFAVALHIQEKDPQEH